MEEAFIGLWCRERTDTSGSLFPGGRQLLLCRARACLPGWRRRRTALTLIGYYLLFSLLLGMDTTTLRLLNRSLYLGPSGSHPSLQDKAGTASFGELSFHLLRGSEAILSAIWHIVSAFQLVVRIFLVHPISSCAIAGWIWIVAETVL